MKKMKGKEQKQKEHYLAGSYAAHYNKLHPLAIFLAVLLLLSSMYLVMVQPVVAPPATWIPELVDGSTDVGEYNSLAFDSAGIPHIAYRRSEPFPTAVLHAYKIGDVWYNETVFKDAGIVGRYISLTIDSLDVLHISFFANDVLYYATNTSGTWTTTIVDEDAWAIVGWYTSIAVDTSNNPRIAYYDRSNERLKYAYYDGSSWKIDVVDSSSKDDVGRYCSLALASDNTPHISYHYKTDANEGRLKHAWKTGNTWDKEIVSDLDYPGRYTFMAVDNTGGLHISHYRLVGGDLMYSNNSGTEWTTQALETIGDVGYYTSLALDNAGEPHIAHFDKTNGEIKRTWKETGAWYTETVVSPGALANSGSISIAFAPDDQPKIAYYDANDGNQMYASGFVNYVDLAVTEMWLMPSRPFDVGASVQVYTNITNLGTLSSGTFIVRFYDGNPTGGGMQIGSDQIVTSLTPGNYSIVNITWTATPIGIHNIYAEVNPDDMIPDPFQGNDKNYTIAQVIGPQMKLEQGWNLISLPLIQTNASLEAVLDPISGDYDAVQYYNCSESGDPWKHYQISKPGPLNVLAELNHIIGFWIHVTKLGGTTFNITGEEFLSPQSIILHPGWNLVGYPSISNKNRTTALNNIVFGVDVDSIWTYNATTKQWKEIGDSGHLDIGRGYWIHSISSMDVTWQVPF